MSFPRYPAYKDSGLDWLGDIPSSWESRPLWTMFRRTKRTGHESEQLLSVYRDHGVIPKASRDDNNNKASDDLEPYQLVQPGDLAINKMKAWQGSVAISEHRGIVSPAYFVYEAGHAEVPKYLHYLLRSVRYTTGYLSMSKGIRVGQWDLDPQYHSRMPVLVPPIDEQTQIATFLDHETAKIDALVAEQEKLIALLKEKRQAVISRAVTKGLDPSVPMRDSGVEWLGEVPAHWNVIALKRIADVQTGVAKGKDNGTRNTITVPYLRVANVQDGYLDLEAVATMEIPHEDLARYALQPGDVLMNEGGDFDKLGRGHVWDGQIDPCITQNHVFAVRPRNVASAWLNAITGSDFAQYYFMTRSKQSTNLASISSTNLMELPVILPPALEQQAILSFIEDQTARFDTLTTEAQRAVLLLQERRTALISAAVTGKIDVRDLQVLEAA
jgi:type I restriction enzyme S subunit